MSEPKRLVTCLDIDTLNKNMGAPDNGDGMVKSERKAEVLQFLEEHPLAMPLSVIYRNLRLHRGITFGKESLRLYMNEFVDDGLVLRLDMDALEDGDIEEASQDDRAYYIITDQGRAELRED